VNDVYGFCGLLIVMTFLLTSLFVWACAAMTGDRIERLEQRVDAIEALLEPTDVDDEPEGVECESIHPAIQQRVSEVLTARGFKQNGEDS
jgi:hypothetical protein